MKNIILASVLLASLGCDELANATDEACSIMVTGCAISIVQDYEYCAHAVADPAATADEVALYCDAFYRGMQCQCVTSACVRDVTFHGYEYDKWIREFVAGLHCPAEVLRPYEEVEK
jgi:hypothetical protein